MMHEMLALITSGKYTLTQPHARFTSSTTAPLTSYKHGAPGLFSSWRTYFTRSNHGS